MFAGFYFQLSSCRAIDQIKCPNSTWRYGAHNRSFYNEFSFSLVKWHPLRTMVIGENFKLYRSKFCVKHKGGERFRFRPFRIACAFAVTRQTTKKKCSPSSVKEEIAKHQ